MAPTGPDPHALDVQAIARRALQRVLAERASREGTAPHSAERGLAGVHVGLSAAPEEPAAKPRGRGRELVDVKSLAATPDGGQFVLPRGALVTELAREEAQRRRIALVDSAGTLSPARGMRRVALGADHGGFALKGEILGWLAGFGAVGVDFGTRDENPCDYPDFARAVALAVASGEVDFGIVIDGAGIGSAMAANKVPGVRAANCHDAAMARNAREHNFANVLTLGAKVIGRNAAFEVVQAFLSTPTGAERHRKRVDKLGLIERQFAPRGGS